MPIADSGQERIPVGGAHLLVCRMADIRRGLSHTAEEGGDQRGERLGQQDIAHAVVIARESGALRIIDAADDCHDAEGYGDGKILYALRQSLEEIDGKNRETQRHLKRWFLELRNISGVSQNKMDGSAQKHGDQYTGDAAGEPHLSQEDGKYNSHSHHADDYLVEYFDERQKTEKQKPDPGDRPQEPGRGYDALHPGAAKRGYDLDDANHEEGGHADLPGEYCVACDDIGGAENGISQADGRRRIETERHGSNIFAARFLLQSDGQIRIDDVAEEDPYGRAGDHACQDDICGIVEREYEDGAHEDEDAEVVEKKSEEGGRLSPKPVLLECAPCLH